MSEASERLRLLESDHSPDGWPAVQMRDITSVLDELDTMYAARAATEIEPYASLVARIGKLTAENREWLRIARGYLDSDSPESNKWLHEMNEMRRGRGALDTPVPIVDQLLAERDKWHQLRQRLVELRAISHPQNEHNMAIDDMIKESE